MPGRITELAANSAAAVGDLIETVDISDTSMAATGTNKKLALADLVTWLNANGISGGAAPTGTKMSALTALTGAGAAGTDLVEVVDISDTTMAASGTNKKLTLAELIVFLQGTFGNTASGGFFKFNWSSTTTAPPATSGVRYNNATAASVTQIYIGYIAKDGTDIKTRILQGVAGDRLYVQTRTNAAKYQIFNVTGVPTDNTTYATIPVTYASGGTALTDADDVLVGFIEAPASETYLGIVELATAAETLTGTDNTRAVHPAGGFATFAAKNVIINAQVGTTYTLVLADAGKMLTMSNAGAITLTVPANATVAFPIGTTIDIVQIGAGKVTVAITGASVVNATPSLGFRAQYSAATLVKYLTDTWILAGDLA